MTLMLLQIDPSVNGMTTEQTGAQEYELTPSIACGLLDMGKTTPVACCTLHCAQRMLRNTYDLRKIGVFLKMVEKFRKDNVVTFSLFGNIFLLLMVMCRAQLRFLFYPVRKNFHLHWKASRNVKIMYNYNNTVPLAIYFLRVYTLSDEHVKSTSSPSFISFSMLHYLTASSCIN